ncbi:ankyrin repeat and protein kinase domain-containing protein 1-like isoform 2-T2 [Fundulus diaphanus]
MSSPYVLSVYGIYQGKPPHENTEQQGIVMEFMERGSIHNLTTDLDGPPPLPLAVQLVYQVALGMQHLHSNKFIHHDLKPSNVLLDKDFNVKLADFGLSRVTASVSSNIQQSTGGTAGTLHYMPPEAFGLNCKATRSFDVYSYGILLWSIFTGKEPYEGKPFELVAFRIQKGDRPDVSLLLNEKNETKKKMVELMRRCWDGDPNKRPTFNDIVEATKLLFSVHKDGIGASVQEVLSKLVPNSQRSSQDHQTNVAACDPSPAQGNAVPNDIVDHPRFAAQQTSVGFGSRNLTEQEKTTFVDDRREYIIQETTDAMAIAKELWDMGMIQKEKYSSIKAKETNEDKMRTLFTTLRQGKRVKAAFYDALIKHNPEMLNS